MRVVQRGRVPEGDAARAWPVDGGEDCAAHPRPDHLPQRQTDHRYNSQVDFDWMKYKLVEEHRKDLWLTKAIFVCTFLCINIGIIFI